MRKRSQKGSRVSVPVTPRQKVILEDVARRSQVSVARVLQEAVKDFIERHPGRELPLFHDRASVHG
jgi:hypothetical protein